MSKLSSGFITGGVRRVRVAILRVRGRGVAHLDLTEAGEQQRAWLGVGVGVGVRGWVRLGAGGWGKGLGLETRNELGGVGGLSHSQLPRCPWVPPLGGRGSAATGVLGSALAGLFRRATERVGPSGLMGRARCGEIWGDVGRYRSRAA